MANRKTALQLVERKSFGGTSYDSFNWQSMFRTYKPANLGIKSAQLFSSELGSHVVNKKFAYYTVAKGNMYMLPGGVDDYEWSVVGDADVDFRITELLVAPTSQPGKGGGTFEFALDRDWLEEPAIIKGENPNLPLIKIIGKGKQRSANSWAYTGELQTGDPGAWFDVKYLQPQMRFIRVSSSVSDELNNKYAGDSFGEMLKLQSWVGNYANKAEFTDKFIRLEISAREGKNPMPSTGYTVGGKTYKDSAIGVGYMYTQPMRTGATNDKEVIEQGVFITKIEARLRERTEMDREMNCEFGQLQKTVDRETGRTLKVGAGWRQIVKDGHYREHNGSLTLSDIYEYVSHIFITRKSFGDRMIKIATGEAGLELLHKMISAEASQFQYVDTMHIRDTQSPYHEYSKEYGKVVCRLAA